MIIVSVKVGGDNACFSVRVRAESIQQAVKIVEGRYPSEDIQVVLPIDPEGFFADGSTAAGLVELGLPESVAG